jgi:hypothetical protein
MPILKKLTIFQDSEHTFESFVTDSVLLIVWDVIKGALHKERKYPFSFPNKCWKIT